MVQCDAGSFCPSNSTYEAICPKGNYCSSTSTQTPCEPGVYCPEGATCTVPASPELIIEYNGDHDAVLERRESEIISSLDEAEYSTGTIAYKLSLSVKPQDLVTVIVSKEAESLATCVKYDDGLFLDDTATYTFDESNWNLPQMVEIAVQRKTNTFSSHP